MARTPGFALEEILSMPLDRAVTELVWRPMGLKRTFYSRVDRDLNRGRLECCAATEDCPWRGGVLQGQVHDDNTWTMGGYAGHAGGNATVDGGDILFLRQTGAVDNPGSFLPTPENRSDIPMFFQDPMRDKGQPPAPATLPEIPVANGAISGNCSNPTQLAPGAYFAINPGTGRGTGQPIQISGCVNFVSTGGFGNYVFFGGASFPSTQTTVTFGPGRYVLAGALPSNPIFSTSNGVVLQDQTPLVNGQSVQNSDAGEIFVFTDLNYPDLQPPPAAEPLMFMVGPPEGWRFAAVTFLPRLPRPWVRPIDVVVFPSPAGVGVIAETRISLPFGFDLSELM